MHHHSSFLYRWRRGTWTSPDNTPFHNDYKVADKPSRGFHILRSLDLLGVREVWRGALRGVPGCCWSLPPCVGRAALLFQRPPTQHPRPSPRALRGRAARGPPTARADTLVKPEGSGASSPPTVRLTLLQTLKLTFALHPSFRAPTSLCAEIWGYTASLTVGSDLSPKAW